MTTSRPLRIVCANDQILPVRETDAEQILSAMSAIGELSDAEVTLLLPATWRGGTVTREALAAYYEVNSAFDVETLPSVFPSFRGLEKLGHGLAVSLSPVVRGADVLYTRNLPTAIATLKLTRTPVVYETFRPWPQQMKGLRPALRHMVTHDRFLGAVLHSRFAGQSFLDIGMPEEKLLVAHNGYDPERMQPVLGRDEARDALGLSQDQNVIAYAGHVSMGKGLGIMLDLAERLADCRFLIIGSYGEGEVERRAASLDNVEIVPWQPFKKTVPYLYAADVLFIPPTRGPLEKVGNTVLPIKTFLYMATGRAIFGGATPDLVEILETGKNAWLVEPDNLKAAYEGLSGLLGDRAKQVRLGRQAALDVAPLTWENRGAAILAFVRERLESVS
jgi:glycosyltransferase involved in cell wall biosynthesis